jgi:hypothetical protein
MAALCVSHSVALEPAKELCVRLDPSNRPACYDTVEAYLSLFTARST